MDLEPVEVSSVKLGSSAGNARVLGDSSPLPFASRAVLAVLSTVVNTYPPGKSEHVSGTILDKVLGAQFLISLFALDAFSWGTGKLFQYEVLLLANDPKLDWCYVIASLVMTSSEIFTEFTASALTPRVFSCVQTRGPMTSKQLVHFALKTYAFSNWFALLVYPWFGVAVHGSDELNSGVVYGLAIVRTLQYAFCNQLGDASIEMAKPHWMMTFQGVKLSFPGCCCACPFQMSRMASAKVLALYLTIMRYITFALIAIVYVSVRKKTSLRWVLAGVLLIWNALAPVILLKQWHRMTRGITDNEVEHEEDNVQPQGSLRGNELSFLGFVVTVKGVLPQATEALQSVMVVELPSTVQQGMLAVGFAIIIIVLLSKIHATPSAPPNLVIDEDSVDVGVTDASHWFVKDWLCPVILTSVLLLVGATCIGIGDKVVFYFAIAVWFLIVPAYQLLRAAIDTFLLRYDELRSTALVYWDNVLSVLINAPLLAANWAAVETVGCDDKDGAEERAAQTLLYIAAGLLSIMVVYYSTVDLFLCKPEVSLHGMVDASSRDRTCRSVMKQRIEAETECLEGNQKSSLPSQSKPIQVGRSHCMEKDMAEERQMHAGSGVASDTLHTVIQV